MYLVFPQSSDDYIVYENAVRVSAEDIEVGEIQRESEQRLNIRCRYDRNNNLVSGAFTGEVT